LNKGAANFGTQCSHCLRMHCISREHLSEEDLRKNKAVLEGLSKGHLVDNPEVIFNIMFSVYLLIMMFVDYKYVVRNPLFISIR